MGWFRVRITASAWTIGFPVNDKFRADDDNFVIQLCLRRKLIKRVLSPTLKPYEVPSPPLPKNRKPRRAKKSREERGEARRLREEEKDRERDKKRLTVASKRKGHLFRHWNSYVVLCEARREVANYEDSQVDQKPNITRKSDPWNWRGEGYGSYVPSAGKIGDGPLDRSYYGPSYEGEEVGYGSLYDACYYNTYER